MIFAFFAVSIVMSILAIHFGLPFGFKNIWLALATLAASVIAKAGFMVYMVSLEADSAALSSYVLPMLGLAGSAYVMISLMAHGGDTAANHRRFN